MRVTLRCNADGVSSGKNANVTLCVSLKLVVVFFRVFIRCVKIVVFCASEDIFR